MMSTDLSLLPSAIADITAYAAESGVITVADRYGLLAAVLNPSSLRPDEKDAVDRLLRAVCRGRIVLVDELSAIL
ncbi:MAG: hypothetical protein ACFE0I_05480 [Elainellaceae cyanobacterium]